MNRQNLDLGHATLAPAGPFRAGAYTTLRFTYTAGHPVDDSGCIKVAFRFASDCGRPQFTHPDAPDYCTVETTATCRIEPRFDPKGHTRPWDRAITLKVMGGFLNTGDQVVLTFGNRTGGSPGWRMQTFCEQTFEFKTLVDPIATYTFKELPESPTLEILPGEPAKAVCIAPSQVETGQAFDYWLKQEDAWGNPVALPQCLTHPGFAQPATHRLDATAPDSGLRALSNPIHVCAPAPETGFQGYWADFHGQSEETIGTNTIEDYFRFGRDFARLDICAHQGNDFQITDAFWEIINDTCARFYEPGRFVTFPGFEWSGNTPLGGDRNIYFATEGGALCHSCTDLLPEQATVHPVCHDAQRLFDELRRTPGPRPFGFAHVGGRYADMQMHDPDVELAVEIHSAWGTFEWLLDDILSRGGRVGVCANSDGHKGRPGASYPGASKFGAYGGLTCVLAKALDREAVLEALFARRFYATTGNRALIDLAVDLSDGRRLQMGACASIKPRTQATLRARIDGTGPIQSVELCRPGLPPVRVDPPLPATGKRILVTWGGAETRGRDRICTWDGQMTVLDNALDEVIAVNFLNPANPVRRIDAHTVAWNVMTTGGDTGLILHVKEPGRGCLQLDTAQGKTEFILAELDRKPDVRAFGGLQKHITATILPDAPGPDSLDIEWALPELATGSQPIWLHMRQEDGHRLWTSPVYLECNNIDKDVG